MTRTSPSNIPIVNSNPKLRQLEKIRNIRVKMLHERFNAECTLLGSNSCWLVALNASYDCGITGNQLLAVFKNIIGFIRIEMCLGGSPFSFVEFASHEYALLAIQKLDTIYNEHISKCLLVQIATWLPMFIPHALQDPSQISKCIPGLDLHLEYISHETELMLIQHVVEEGELGRWQALNKRSVQHYSFRFDYPSKSVDRDGIQLDNAKMPRWTNDLLTMYAVQFPSSPVVDQLTLNMYTQGGGIAPHTDRHSSFLSPILLVSLGSSIVMEFRKLFVNGVYTTHSVLLPPRSLAIMHKDARYAWEHCIRPRKIDLVNGLAVERGTRYSLTFRSIRDIGDECTCGNLRLCD